MSSWFDAASQFLSGSWAFVRRHKKKFIVGGAAVALVGGYYWWKKRSEAAELEQQKKLPYIKRMRHFFTKNKEAANDALRKMLPEVRAALHQLLEVEQLATQLKERDSLSSNDSKLIWERLKIESITRMITALYSASLVNMFFSLQLNLIGRVLFQSFLAEERQKENSEHAQQEQIESETRKNSNNCDNDDSLLPQSVQRQFFAYAFHFQTNGIKVLADRVKHHVVAHFTSVPLKSQRFTARQLCELISNVCHDLELEFEQEAKQAQNDAARGTITLCSILLPNDNHPEHPPIVHDLLNELRDLLESEQIVHVLHDTAVQLFQVMFKHVEKMVLNGHRKHSSKEVSLSSSSTSSLSTTTTSSLNNESQLQEVSVPAAVATAQQFEEAPSTCLGHIISRIMNESKFVLSESQDNDYVQAVQSAAALNNFCGMVYTNGLDI